MSDIDTDGVYDRCGRCGERARVIYWSGKHGAECTACPNAIELCVNETAAMVRWNLEQREMAEAKRKAGAV